MTHLHESWIGDAYLIGLREILIHMLRSIKDTTYTHLLTDIKCFRGPFVDLDRPFVDLDRLKLIDWMNVFFCQRPSQD